jgi:hypothetical protein
VPELNAIGVRVGGEDQAWLYSEDIRDAWTTTPGAMAMLRAVASSNTH